MEISTSYTSVLGFDFSEIVSRNGVMPKKMERSSDVDEFGEHLTILATYEHEEQVSFQIYIALTVGGELIRTQSWCLPINS